MSIVTIHCRLIAPESCRSKIWDLMALKNTPMINEILKRLSNHEELESWYQTGRLPNGLVTKICDQLKNQPPFDNQPSRFYLSVTNLVEYIYKSYLRTQKQLRFRLQRQQRWYQMLKSDSELKQEAQCSLTDIRNKAQSLLAKYTNAESLSQSLFDAYNLAEDKITKVAISYLLKNGCKIPQKVENIERFVKRRRKVKIKIERLEKRIAESSPPMGRDLSDEKWINILNIVCQSAPQTDEQGKQWQDQLLKQSKSVPYPLIFNTNEDLIWSKNEKGRLCVTFNGLTKKGFVFEVCCDQRQLKWFERFYQDQQVKRQSKNQHSSALFSLRSGMLLWREGEGKQKPWTKNHLALFCSLETQFETIEGTELIKQQKVEEVLKTIENIKNKGELTKTQENFLQRKQSTLARLDNPFPRPSKPLYQGNPTIVIGVSMGIEKPATIAVVNQSTGEVIAYRSLKQLLGDDYKLLNLQRLHKQKQSHKRHKSQRDSSSRKCNKSQSELGQYIDRLLAKEIVAIARTYKVGRIVVPSLNNIRESIQAELTAKAEAKIQGSLEAQKRYLKNYRINVHQWSYGRLIENITLQASKLNIIVTEAKQSIRGSPQEKAKHLALSSKD
ncbi:type V CRISPR-associated protein Cas12k [Cyanobacterium aponinum]|uniref:type V CRISPR-associated protein Cas12k n=1 Tax=Cyanobacterium aponinum TaxID=379064 RepID=UPI000C12C487|nr:type V CRISPR-associated protein Cas12k [Cyanobacterium aponinum]PHV63803.1 hypothetical protein CSQ80_03060 [Cyanobacterium aponinum IPPAS B-1201]